MSRIKGKQIRKYKKSVNRYFKRLGKAKKCGDLKPIRKQKKGFLDKIINAVL